MTIHLVCAVFDSAVAAYMQPFFVPSKGVAVRSFTDEVCRSGSPMAAHPEDYFLFVLGAYDDIQGSIVCHTPEQLVRAQDYVR